MPFPKLWAAWRAQFCYYHQWLTKVKWWTGINISISYLEMDKEDKNTSKEKMFSKWFWCVFPFYWYCYLFIAIYLFVSFFYFCFPQQYEQPEGFDFATIISEWQKWNGELVSIFPFFIYKWIKKIKIFSREKYFQERETVERNKSDSLAFFSYILKRLHLVENKANEFSLDSFVIKL